MPEGEIILDLSRLLSRVLHPTPTGVDRVELAYARGLLAAVPRRLAFAAVHPLFGYGRLPTGKALRFLDAVERRWEEDGLTTHWTARRFALRWLFALWPRRPPRRSRGTPVFVKASPNNLAQPQLIERILRRERARFVCLVHDLIPLEYPEYARPDGARLHERRIRTITRLADGIIANSHATMASLAPWITRSGRNPMTTVAHLGTEAPRAAVTAATPPARPYFVCIGTIEPRKNHLLLLNIWRRMAERDGPNAIPKLIIIGRRGWENEQVVDMLERSPLLVDCVEEKGRLPDHTVRSLIAGARALLMPSFAEGYGMPVAEALSLGTPVICSELPALREAGGDVPEYIDPLDGPTWLAVICAYTTAESTRAVAQQARIAEWAAPSWTRHIAIVVKIVHSLAA